MFFTLFLFYWLIFTLATLLVTCNLCLLLITYITIITVNFIDDVKNNYSQEEEEKELRNTTMFALKIRTIIICILSSLYFGTFAFCLIFSLSFCILFHLNYVVIIFRRICMLLNFYFVAFLIKLKVFHKYLLWISISEKFLQNFLICPKYL